MKEYMTADHPLAFEGMEKKDGLVLGSGTVECPVCHGYGGWHLRIYGPGNYFNCWCMQCEGYGYVHEANARCIHTFQPAVLTPAERQKHGPLFRTDHAIRCTKCQQLRIYDSSD